MHAWHNLAANLLFCITKHTKTLTKDIWNSDYLTLRSNFYDFMRFSDKLSIQTTDPSPPEMFKLIQPIYW